MTFASYEFGLFFAVCFLTCVLILGRLRCRSAGLCLFSLAFLWFSGGWKSIFWYCLSAFTVWAGALAMEKKRKQQPGMTRAVFWAVVCINLLLLAIFKYANFPGYTMADFCWLTGKEWQWEPLVLTAPVAISFYTLTLLGYFIEVFWGSVQPEKSYWRLALFGGFFPQMAMGPIARYESLSRTLFSENPVSGQDMLQGLFRIFWGLFQKLVISERLAVIVNTIYGDTITYSGSYLILAAVCFSFQLYTDFGGAIQIVTGAAQMLGVRLEENFRQPFYSRSVAEFWRRWHITLGSWFKDFVMYPLLKSNGFQSLGRWAKKRFGKKQGKKVPTAAGLVTVWFLLGLWHGGKWTFIIGSGLYHALLMTLSLFAEPWTAGLVKKLRIPTDCGAWVLFQRLRTFVLVTIGFVFFRSDSLSMAAEIFRGMVSGEPGAFTLEGITSLGLPAADLALLLIALLILWAVSWRQEHENAAGICCTAAEENRSACLNRRESRTLALCFSLAFLVLIFGYYGHGYDASAFIYSQF